MTARLISPDMVELACIDLLGGVQRQDGSYERKPRHPEHLAALERYLGMDPETIERLKTVDLLEDEFKFTDAVLPMVRLAIEEFDDQPNEYRTPDGRTVLALAWQMQLDIYTLGEDYRDAMQRVRWLTMTVAECLLERLPRRDLVEHLLWTGARFGVTDKALGRAETTWRVLVPDALTVIGHLPVDADDQPPAGGPGGAPGAPYVPPEPWPAGLDIDLEADRVPITEET